MRLGLAAPACGLVAALACGPAPETASQASTISTPPSEAPAPLPADEVAERARRMAERAFWNQPATIAELGLARADRERLDALVPELLTALVAANRAHRRTAEAWSAALRAGDEAAAGRLGADLADTAAAVARAQTETKTRLVAALGPAAAERLAERYPKLLAAPWVRANRLVDTSDLAKFAAAPGGTPR